MSNCDNHYFCLFLSFSQFHFLAIFNFLHLFFTQEKNLALQEKCPFSCTLLAISARFQQEFQSETLQENVQNLQEDLQGFNTLKSCNNVLNIVLQELQETCKKTDIFIAHLQDLANLLQDLSKNSASLASNPMQDSCEYLAHFARWFYLGSIIVDEQNGIIKQILHFFVSWLP